MFSSSSNPNETNTKQVVVFLDLSKNLTSEESHHLELFLDKNPNINFFWNNEIQSEPYEFKDGTNQIILRLTHPFAYNNNTGRITVFNPQPLAYKRRQENEKGDRPLILEVIGTHTKKNEQYIFKSYNPIPLDKSGKEEINDNALSPVKEGKKEIEELSDDVHNKKLPSKKGRIWKLFRKAEKDHKIKFLHEQDILRKLSAFRVKERFEDTEYLFLPMRKFDLSLTKFLSNQDKKSLTFDDDAITICLNLAYALKELHDKGILHKDIKPDNIMIDPETLEVVIIDYDVSTFKHNLDKNIVSGTAGYYAPELESPISYEKMDVFSLGRTFCKIFGEKLSFLNNLSAYEKALLDFQNSQTTNFPMEINKKFEDDNNEVITLIKNMLAYDPNNRFDSVGVIDALHQIRLNRFFEKNHICEKEQINFAHQTGKKVYVGIKQLVSQGNLNLNLVANTINTELDKINDSPLAIQEFIFSTRIKTLVGCNNKNEVKEKIIKITDEFKTNIQKLLLFSNEAGFLLSHNHHNFLRNDVTAFSSKVQEVMSRYYKYEITLDDMAEFTEHLKKKNNELNTVLNEMILKITKKNSDVCSKLQLAEGKDPLIILKNKITTAIRTYLYKRQISDARLVNISKILAVFDNDNDINTIKIKINNILDKDIHVGFFGRSFLGSELYKQVKQALKDDKPNPVDNQHKTSDQTKPEVNRGRSNSFK